MRIVYLGTPEMAVATLRALVGAGHDVALVVTASDKRRGRGGALVPSAVKTAASELGLPVTDRIDDILELDPRAELGVVVAYGRLIKPHVFETVPMVNVHFSLLPRWRGAAPLERAILAGDERTGVCLMDIEETLDTGGVYGCTEVPIHPDATAAQLRAALVDAGTELVLDALDHGLGPAVPQVGEPVYAKKIEPHELELDWTRPAVELHRIVRLGGAWTTHHGRRLKVWRSALPASDEGIAIPTGTEPLGLVEVQPEGKRRMPARAWANGAHWRAGERLGE
ncbi:MAG TPA: methionyl-tRNA formyltransferase [Acidimicrobiales bacterium]|nr:methionyl-tRNA formyltransferase [Acidimicrobiales bacterium]